MADVAGILWLMRHAADRLGEEDGKVSVAFGCQLDQATTGYDRSKATSGLASYVAAATYAQTVLRMVADFMTDANEGGVDG